MTRSSLSSILHDSATQTLVDQAERKAARKTQQEAEAAIIKAVEPVLRCVQGLAGLPPSYGSYGSEFVLSIISMSSGYVELSYDDPDRRKKSAISGGFTFNLSDPRALEEIARWVGRVAPERVREVEPFLLMAEAQLRQRPSISQPPSVEPEAKRGVPWSPPLGGLSA
jgi:hypothetical protein